MIERVRAERRGGLELADGRHPVRNVPAVAAAPALDRERELRGPQHQRSERSEQRVAARVEQVYQALQLAHALAGRVGRESSGLAAAQRLGATGEPGRLERFCLDPVEQLREHREVARGAVDALHRVEHPPAKEEETHGLDQPEHQQRARAQVPEQPTGGRGHVGRRDQRQQDAQRAEPPELLWGGGPALERSSRRALSWLLDEHVHGFTERVDLLAKLRALPQVCHRRLALAHLDGGRRLEQPARERVGAAARSCDREQLEQRAATEEVEIPRVEVLAPAVEARTQVALTAVAGAGPATIETLQPPAMEERRATRAIASPQHSLVHREEHDEHEQRQRGPPRREQPLLHREPADEQRGHDRAEARVGDPYLAPRPRAQSSLAFRQARGVHLARPGRCLVRGCIRKPVFAR